jgi:hypothetical protein
MASIGKGISDAVRNHIPVWIDDAVVNVLYSEYKKANGMLSKEGLSGFKSRIKSASSWVRKSRKSTNTGFERLYHCKTVQKATLIVHSPPKDDSANAYVFMMDGKPIAGGKTKLKSTHVTTALSKDKTSLKAIDVQFVKFSEAELISMRTRMEFGDGFEFLEMEREV